MPRLRIEFEAIHQATSQINSIHQDVHAGAGAVNGAVGDLMTSWMGGAAKVFGGWWNDTSTPRAQYINDELLNLASKLAIIAQLVDQLDTALAARFQTD
jgi:WXG100 family type VII secretion target